MSINLLGTKLSVIGMHVMPECKEYEKVQCNIFIEICSQTDAIFLYSVISRNVCPDIIIDDGICLDHHIVILRHLYPHVRCHSVSAVEVCLAIHTIGDPSYDKDFDGPTRYSLASFSHVLQKNQRYRRKHATQPASVYKTTSHCTSLGFMTTLIRYFSNLNIYNKDVKCVYDQLLGPTHYDL